MKGGGSKTSLVKFYGNYGFIVFSFLNILNNTENIPNSNAENSFQKDNRNDNHVSCESITQVAQEGSAWSAENPNVQCGIKFGLASEIGSCITKTSVDINLLYFDILTGGGGDDDYLLFRIFR